MLYARWHTAVRLGAAPGEDTETLDKVQTRWPEFKGNNIPQPAIVAIQRADGHEVGTKATNSATQIKARKEISGLF